MSKNDIELRWQELLRLESIFFDARKAFLTQSSDVTTILAEALKTPHQRGTALRILLTYPDESIRPFLDTLIELASVGHSDVGLSRSVILRINSNWLIRNIDSHAKSILSTGNEEEFRRIAELYNLIDRDLLKLHLERCDKSADPEIREIVDDFKCYLWAENKR